MALVERSARASLDASTGMFAPQITGLIAGENLDPVAPCRIDATDNKVYMTNGTAADADAGFIGFTPTEYLEGEAVTLHGLGSRYHYSDGDLTPMQFLYAGATAGRLDDAATVGGPNPIARAITTTDIVVIAASEV